MERGGGVRSRRIGAISIAIHDGGAWANLGYGLHPDHWGKGLVVEAVRPLIPDAFKYLEVGRIEISAAAPNLASRRVAEKLGFTYEGTLRQRMVVREKRYDAVYYGLLRGEWRS